MNEGDAFVNNVCCQFASEVQRFAAGRLPLESGS